MLSGIKGVGLISLLLITCSQCTKEDPLRTYRIEKETREWTMFKPGSYWVYQLSTDPSTLDSTYVSSFTESMTSGIDQNGNKFKTQKLEIKYNTRSGSYISQIENRLPRGNSLKVQLYNTENTVSSSLDLMLIFPLNFIDGSENDNFSIISNSDILTVGKDLITDVIHIKCKVRGLSGILTNQTYYNEYWICQNKWIVKMIIRNQETGDSEEWKLARFKVMQ